MFGQEPLRQAQPEAAATDLAAARAARTAASKLRGRSASSTVRMEWRQDGTLQSAAGFVSRPYSGSKAEVAQAFVAENQDLLGRVRAEDLPVQRSHRIRTRTYVRLQQHLGGIPVRGADVVLQVGDDNAVHAIQSGLASGIVVKGEWRLDAQSAIDRAVAGAAMQPSGAPQAVRQFVVRDRTARPVWRVVFASADPPGDWEILVSAMDGAIVETRNLRRGHRALGYAYPRNPIAGGLEQVSLNNLQSATYLTSSQTRVFSYLPALRGEVSPGTVVQGATRTGGNFLYPTNDTRFSEVQLYYGMESASERFRQLGFAGFDSPLSGVVLYQDYDAERKRFNGSDNAFFSPVAFDARGGMFFYLTTRQGDTSLDTDVIYHEYGHAVVNAFAGPYQSDVFSALNEGTADYFSSSFMDDPVMGEYVAELFRTRSPFLRRTDNTNSWPYNIVGEEHADGNIWSGALWDVRAVLGPAAADEIALNAIAMLSSNSEFFHAAAAAVTVAEELFGSYAAEIVAAVMEARGIYTSAARTAANTETLSPGEVRTGRISAAKPGLLLLGHQQYRIDVPHRAGRLLVRVEASANVRFYLRYRVPITVEEGRLVAEHRSPDAATVAGYISMEHIPELQRGSYYVAVVNTSEEPVEYSVSALIDREDRSPQPALTILQSGVSAKGSAPSGPFLASRQFAIDVPEGTPALSITLEGDQDVDLFLRLNRFVYVNNMGHPEADLVSDSPSSREDLRIINPHGGALPAGRYVIGVHNYSPATATFRVRAVIEP